VSSQIVSVESITGAERDRMFRLMYGDYLGMERSTFNADLGEKRHVMILREQGLGEIVGFSTLMVIDLEVSGKPVHAVFSGDTIVQSEFRHTLRLGIELGHYLHQVSDAYPHDTVVWLLISKGCRTYGVLPLLFREFFPRWDAPTPPFYQDVIDAFGSSKYPSEYDRVTHVIHPCGYAQRLRPGVAPATEARLRDPNARFFVQANPGHKDGDELVCVADAGLGNWSTRFRRMVGV
jgi:hypothetical protein